MPTTETATTTKPRRTSVFHEIGLTDEKLHALPHSLRPRPRPQLRVRFKSKADILGETSDDEWEDVDESDAEEPTITAIMPGPGLFASALRSLGFLALVFALVIVPVVQQLSGSATPLLGVSAGSVTSSRLAKRDNTPTDVCKRWSQQSALVNGTLYLYGGRSTTGSSQKSNTWNNDFLSLDLTNSWQISNPSFTGLARPSGPPPVANGYLWNSYDSLFLYGGEFSDNPTGDPTPFSLWEYNIKESSWKEHKSPKTSAGINSEDAGLPIERSAEGAGFSMASLGRGWYFGGHLDFLTTDGWSIQTPRVYLKSFVEFTFPGYTNNELSASKTAGSDGAWRNITKAGIQDQAGFTQRADGLLVYVPGFGKEGILLSLGGGTNETFTQMNQVDVFDIAGSTWYRQATSGKTPNIRVNPCAVVAAAPDGSSYNVYMFGGQNLIPAGSQTQYDDMWILSIPSFTWIPVDMGKQAVPYPRAGHTCNVWDGQMVVVGGYIGQDISCESPGVYVFNMSSLEWSVQFNSLTGSLVHSSDSKVANPFSQHPNQRGTDLGSGLQGSYGYQVPAAVISVIGGSPTGGATITAPVQSATSGPLASGRPITYTVTGPNGAVITETGVPGQYSGSSGGGGGKPNIGAIVAGVVAGLFFLIAVYLAFCAMIYRKQLHLYKAHVAATQRAAANKDHGDTIADGFWAGPIAPGSGAASAGRSSWQQRFGGKTSSEGSTGFAGGAGLAQQSGGSASQSQSQPSSGTAGVGDSGGGLGRASSEAGSSSEDLLEGQEPSFWGWNGVLLNPRRSLRVVNRD
ncbi:hypothetical protein EJ06DRAFT_528494 [Trichodelitschia bisporula]|uniref:Galactose oxidase n=1 Tax=Trichodelitschia bisporula TaxID=703511 RepID=A0A6G1I244_9PEZI|nr:hypothetical protein EJ06DRAFT_528494 [Trichodelitschia bisporula]